MPKVGGDEVSQFKTTHGAQHESCCRIARIRTPESGRRGIDRMVAVTPRHVTWVMPVFGAHPYMEVWQESKATELSVRESTCTTKRESCRSDIIHTIGVWNTLCSKAIDIDLGHLLGPGTADAGIQVGEGTSRNRLGERCKGATRVRYSRSRCRDDCRSTGLKSSPFRPA